MDIEYVRVLTTLSCGDKVWDKGSLIKPPIPPVILNEIRQNTGTVLAKHAGESLVHAAVSAGLNVDTSETGPGKEGSVSVFYRLMHEDWDAPLEVTDIAAFAKKYKIYASGLYNVAAGRNKRYKGFTVEKVIR